MIDKHGHIAQTQGLLLPFAKESLHWHFFSLFVEILVGLVCMLFWHEWDCRLRGTSLDYLLQLLLATYLTPFPCLDHHQKRDWLSHWFLAHWNALGWFNWVNGWQSELKDHPLGNSYLKSWTRMGPASADSTWMLQFISPILFSMSRAY